MSINNSTITEMYNQYLNNQGLANRPPIHPNQYYVTTTTSTTGGGGTMGNPVDEYRNIEETKITMGLLDRVERLYDLLYDRKE